MFKDLYCFCNVCLIFCGEVESIGVVKYDVVVFYVDGFDDIVVVVDVVIEY